MKRATWVTLASVCLFLAAGLVAMGQDNGATEPVVEETASEASVPADGDVTAADAVGEAPSAVESEAVPTQPAASQPAWGMPEEEDTGEIELTSEQRALYEKIASEVSQGRMERGVRDLASLGSRLSGTPGNMVAGSWVVDQFRRIGLENVRIEEFEVTIPVDHGTWLDLDGEEIRVYPLWPNLIRTCSVPTDGVEADLVDGGSGALSDFRGKPIDDSIVLMDWTDDVNWFNAPLLGARGVVFIEPELISRGGAESKFLSVPADVPRFWIPRAEGLALRERLSGQSGRKARLFSDVRWESRTTFNVLGELQGTEDSPMPGYSDGPGADQRVVITSYYDSISVVPDLAPGAENAASLVTMLEVARVLKNHPPRRSVLFLATSGHFQSLYGIRDFFNRRFSALVRADAEVKTILESAAERSDTVGPMDVAAVFGLDISSRNDLLCAMYKGYFYDYREDIQWKYSDYGSNSRDWARGVQMTLGYPTTTYADAINSITGRNWRSYLPGRLAMDFEEATIASRPAIGFCTGNDMRAYVDTPHDVPEHVNFTNLKRQATMVSCVLKRTLDDDKLGGLIDKNDKYQELDKDNFCTAQGRVVEFQPKNEEYLPNTPVPGAVAVTRGYPKTSVGVRGDAVQLVDRDAKFAYQGLPNAKMARGGASFGIHAYFLHPETGNIVMAPDRGPNGETLRPLQQDIDAATKDWKITVFNCATTNLFDIVDQRQFMLLGSISVLDSVTDSAPLQFGYALPEPTPAWTSYFEPVATVFAAREFVGGQQNEAAEYDEEHLKLLLGAGALGMRFILLNADADYPTGRGYNFTENPHLTPTPWYVVNDLWAIDEHRIQTLTRYGIKNKRSSDMHSDAKLYIDQAEAALESYDYASFLSSVRTALAYEMRVYPDVMKTTTDVVKAVIFYLALLIPFAYFMERLFLASPHIVKQVAGATGFFIIIFMVLWFVHPAFELTKQPIIVLLAFIMLALAVMVSSLIVSQFDHRMRLLRQQVTGVRETDVGRLSASGTAFSLGVANMRRRKTRTALTCVTLILLTFTVISFTSVVEEVKLNWRPTDPGGAYQGLLIRQLQWEPLGLPARRILENEFENRPDVTIAPRAWYIASQVGNVSFVPLEYGDLSIDARALVGLSPQEKEVTGIDQTLIHGRWFEPTDRGPKCILPAHMCTILGLTPEDVATPDRPGAEVQVLGWGAELIGIVDAKQAGAGASGLLEDDGRLQVSEIKDVDSEEITPVDYQSMQQQRREGGSAQGGGEDAIERYTHLPPDLVGFVNLDFALDAGGTLRSIAVKFEDEERLREAIPSLLQRIELNVYARVGDDNYLLSTRQRKDVQGAGSVLVPLFIAALIVLNTMLGSVYERTREIGIFSSLGLAPVHVASLFVAEALVYAVLGAVCGYLVGQTLSKFVVMWNLFGGALSLNYSSVSAVATIIIVMLTVLASTAYPAQMASRLATPGIDRRWRMVDPKEGVLAIDLPFSSTRGDVRGLNVFIHDYLSAHVEYSTGQFSADNVHLAEMPITVDGVDGDCYQLSATLWLAPYDLGVRERFTIISQPTPEMGEGSYGFFALIKREDGDEASWIRLTRNLLTILRQQFLLWRTFNLETRKPYIEREMEIGVGDPELVAMLKTAQGNGPSADEEKQPEPTAAD